MKNLPGLFLGLFVVSQSFGQSLPSTEDLAFFEQKIRPLLIEQCYSCHSATAKKIKGGLLLDSREAILKGGDTGPSAVVGDPGKSLLIQAVHYKDTDMQMPPKGKLGEREVANLEQWVRRGLAFPASASTAKPARKIDIEAGRKFWSFQPLRSPEVPKIQAGAWPKQRIDSFILAELEKRSIKPGEPAPKRVLLRRAKFDLLGLPPTPEEVEAFEKDSSPIAFAKVIDQWLASPQYGERWGRHWLDLTRYCDIAEAWVETKGQPHYYRDWVVRAVNEDVPFPRFAKLQLAADQMPDAKTDDLAALGFIGLSPTYWKELQLPVEIIKTIVSDEYEERIHTLSSTFLGLNIACARCHDHKFDPITAEDYYALAGVFASSKQADQALVPGVNGDAIVQIREQVVKLEAEVKKLGAKKEKIETAKIEDLQKQIAKLKATPGYEAPLIPGLRDASLQVVNAVGTHGSRVIYQEKPQDIALEIRGNPNKPGPMVSRRFVSVLSRGEPAKFTKGSGRLELANSLVTDSSPLVARVFVNRVWKEHFGIGIVETPSDFGKQGEPPSHPDLLEDLASRFIANGWSIKWLHREIMLSATYQQASGPAPNGDAGYRYYSKFPRRRLDVEAWRDALLYVTGSLDLKMGGPPTELNLATNHRRTIYGVVRRRELTDILRLHDFPDPITHSPNRIPTITPLQQLFTLNSPLMAEQSMALVKRLQADAGTDPAKRIERAYKLLFGRSPTGDQLKLGQAFVQPNNESAWQQYAQVLLGSNEFQFVD
ncbi:PSD1 and planctomycete cytochrome C domain-containing protein [Zavarzinella formosa]|uniref:PSD1 and planctomycete cytochrome C domain-containing protein n=1 Tax=Zavarzinella formosa TaxID=360055 RepID=UPI0003040649|nr:PSD1 and planctomycete cytochrome C domain-containing protein [Zavarzinella formosa]